MPKPPIQVFENKFLAPYTTWRIGGHARWFAEPTVNELPALLEWAFESGVPIHYLGRGSNILISDGELPRLFILTRNSMTGLSRNNNHIIAEGEIFLPHVSKLATRKGFSEFEFMIGIPRTVGGALAMNAGLTVFRPREMVSVADSWEEDV